MKPIVDGFASPLRPSCKLLDFLLAAADDMALKSWAPLATALTIASKRSTKACRGQCVTAKPVVRPPARQAPVVDNYRNNARGHRFKHDRRQIRARSENHHVSLLQMLRHFLVRLPPVHRDGVVHTHQTGQSSF